MALIAIIVGGLAIITCLVIAVLDIQKNRVELRVLLDHMIHGESLTPLERQRVERLTGKAYEQLKRVLDTRG